MWERKKNIIVSDHQIFWVSHSPALLDKCNRTSCNRCAVSLTSAFFCSYNRNSEIGKKVAVESCPGTPLCLDPLLHQEREVTSHLLGWLPTSVPRQADRLWSPPGQQQGIQRQSLLREVREADIIFWSLWLRGGVSGVTSIRGRAWLWVFTGAFLEKTWKGGLLCQQSFLSPTVSKLMSPNHFLYLLNASRRISEMYLLSSG